MEVITCRNCGRLFNYIRGERNCPGCQKKLEEKFIEVKKYVRENPSVDINTISKDMEVSVRQLNQWVREERLIFSDDSPVGLPCESCGITIKMGRYCDSCKQKMTEGLKEAAGLNRKEEPTRARRQPTSNKMRFLDN